MPGNDAPETEIETGNTIFSHLTELRNRAISAAIFLVLGTVIAYFFADQIFDFLMQPLANAMGENSTQRLIYTHLAEGFITQIKLAFFTALYLGMPFILLQFWRFIAPALYRNEERALLPFFIATPLLFYLGGAVVYYLVMPLAWEFFLSFQTGLAETALPIQLEARISDYLSLIISFIFAFGICFELPVLLGLLVRAGILTKAQLKKNRRYAILGAFIFGAFLTPPDILSQITLASAIIILYELSILFAGKKAVKTEIKP